MNLKNIFVGNKHLQFLFEKMYRISLRGMNYGTAGFVESSGEVNIIKKIPNTFSKEEKLVLFDVGANDGDYASSILASIHVPFQLHCFEPAQLAFNSLRKNTENSNQINYNNFGLGDQKAELDLFYDKEGTGWASLYPIEHNSLSVKFDQSEKVSIDTLDSYCQDNGVNRIHFLKMDVEGHELSVLKGSKEMLEQGNIDLIQFEFGIANLVSKVLLHEFFTLLKGYDIFRILKNGIQKIEYNERYELFLTSNYLAVKQDERKLYKHF